MTRVELSARLRCADGSTRTERYGKVIAFGPQLNGKGRFSYTRRRAHGQGQVRQEGQGARIVLLHRRATARSPASAGRPGTDQAPASRRHARARRPARPRRGSDTPSLAKMLRRCDSTVLALRNSSAAISRLVLRSVTRSAISSSRSVREARPSASGSPPRRRGLGADAELAQLAPRRLALARRAAGVELALGDAQHLDRPVALAGRDQRPPEDVARPGRPRAARRPRSAASIERSADRTAPGGVAGVQQQRRPERARRSRAATPRPMRSASCSLPATIASAASRSPRASSTSARCSRAQQRSNGDHVGELEAADAGEHRLQPALELAAA